MSKPKLENKRGLNVQGHIILSDDNFRVDRISILVDFLILLVLFQEMLDGKNPNICPLLFNFLKVVFIHMVNCSAENVYNYLDDLSFSHLFSSLNI
jgi:hypothetical protein